MHIVDDPIQQEEFGKQFIISKLNYQIFVSVLAKKRLKKSFIRDIWKDNPSECSKLLYCA